MRYLDDLVEGDGVGILFAQAKQGGCSFIERGAQRIHRTVYWCRWH